MRAKKRLGQHFLRDVEVLQDIAAVADVGRSAGALEIGPGEGALTAFLLQSGKPVVALEKDPDAIEVLKARFSGEALTLVEGDALHADLAGLLPRPEGALPVVVGNLPYNVGTAIYTRLLGLRGQISRIVVMLQREVARRIVATAGTKAYGVPSVLTALTARAHMVLEVPPQAFRPRPKVHSAVVLAEFPGEALAQREELEPLAKLVSRLFQARRKVLSNAIEGVLDIGALEAMGIDPRARPETLTPAQFLALYRGSVATGSAT